MTLESFIDIRFADPVMCMSLNENGLAYGSALGRILYHDFHTHLDTPLSEFSEEAIRGIHLTEDNVLSAAVGDLHCIVANVFDNNTEAKRTISHARSHSADLCPNVQVLMHRDVILLVEIENTVVSDDEKPDNLFVTWCKREDYLSFRMEDFGQNTVPLDFNGTAFLWLEWQETARTFYKIDINTRVTLNSKILDGCWGAITHVKMTEEGVLLVRNHREIVIISLIDEEEFHVGTHEKEIIAIDYCDRRPVTSASSGISECYFEEVRTDLLNVILSVDIEGGICIWSNHKLIERIYICNLEAITAEYRKKEYFSMGYPYFIEMFGSRIAVSTDFGVIVIKSRFFSNLQERH